MQEKSSFFQRLSERFPLRSKAGDEEEARIASLLNFLTVMALVIVVLSFLASISLADSRAEGLRTFLQRAAPIMLVFVAAQVAMRMGYFTAAAYVVAIGYWINTCVEVVANGGVFSPSLIAFVVSILMAGLLLGTRASFVTAGASLLVTILVAVLHTSLPTPLASIGVPNQAVSACIAMVNATGLLYLYLRQLNQVVDRLKKANLALEQTGKEMEQRVAERTRMLETSVQISRRLTTILDVNDLVRAVVDELQKAFHYYHVHIYLYDERQENLMMTGGTGDAGRAMLARGHRLARGKGLVGRAAETNSAVLAPDTYQEPDWLPNPLLPETRSELAAPIAIGEQVLGVLDVQQNKVGALQASDVELMLSIASQVAVAVQNARAYAQARDQAQREALVAGISQKIQRATSVESVLQIAVSELGKALDARRTSVELQSSEAAGMQMNELAEGAS